MSLISACAVSTELAQTPLAKSACVLWVAAAEAVGVMGFEVGCMLPYLAQGSCCLVDTAKSSFCFLLLLVLCIFASTGVLYSLDAFHPCQCFPFSWWSSCPPAAVSCQAHQGEPLLWLWHPHTSASAPPSLDIPNPCWQTCSTGSMTSQPPVLQKQARICRPTRHNACEQNRMYG